LKEIKAKQVIKDIKTLDKTADVSRRMKNAYIRTKNQTELPEHNNNSSYVNDAENSIRDGTGTIVKKAGHIVENYGKKVFRKMKESIRQSVSQPGAGYSAINSFQPGRKKVVYQSDTYSKTECPIKQPTEPSRKTAKKTVKGNIKTSYKSVKTSEHTTKATIKTSQAATKTAVKTAAKSAQASKSAVNVTRMTARAAATNLKMAARSITVAVKATIAAGKGIVALIAAGGWIVVIVILVICLAGFLIGSVYGVFFSNESSSRNTSTMSEVIIQLNEEFSSEIKRIQDDNPHDTLEFTGNGSCIVNNWPEILAVYAVKVSTNQENSMEVATLDEIKVGILGGVFRDMNIIDYWIEIAEHTEVVSTTDKDGKEAKKTITVTETILYMNITAKSYFDMIEQYNFNVQQVKMLNELMQDENQQLFMQLISG